MPENEACSIGFTRVKIRHAHGRSDEELRLAATRDQDKHWVSAYPSAVESSAFKDGVRIYAIPWDSAGRSDLLKRAGWGGVGMVATPLMTPHKCISTLLEMWFA